jgi:predicted oxidoreductase
MHTIPIGVSPLNTSRLAYGCWRIAGTWNPAEVTAASRADGLKAIQTAYDAGYTLFDTADIYCSGESERILGDALKKTPGMREKVVVATKCGIRFAGDPSPDAPARYDFSAEHIEESVEGSLARMKLETIDLLMLHRPDFLANPEEIAGAFSALKNKGKVRYFGVSNFRPLLLTALQAACPMPLIVHQVEISLAKLDAFTDGTLDQCLIERLTPMAWSPLAAGLIGSGGSKLLPSQQSYQPERFRKVLEEISSDHQTSPVVIALAWLLKHPATIQPVVGSIRPERIREATKATEVVLSREEWYRLLLAARGEPLP